MDREEAKKRFNALPKEYRVTISAVGCDDEIRFLEHQKKYYTRRYKEDIKRLNERIKFCEKHLKELE